MFGKTGIKDNVIDEICSLARIHGLNTVILFGSRARNDFKERSDIDLAVSGGDIAAFMLDIEEDVNTLLFFDIVNLDGPADQELLKSIHREGVLIYEKVC